MHSNYEYIDPDYSYTDLKNLVVMDMEAFVRRESMLELRENLLAVEEDRAKGKQGLSIEEVSARMKQAVQEVIDAKKG